MSVRRLFEYKGKAGNVLETNKRVGSIIALSGQRRNIEAYTIGETDLVVFQIKAAEKVAESSLQAVEGVSEVLLQGNSLTLGVSQDLKEALALELEKTETVSEEEEKNIGQKVMDVIQGIFAPILAPLTGAGILQGITILLLVTGIVPEGNAEEAVLNSISGAVFYFMPILLAFSSAKVFKASPYLAVTVAGFLLHPDLIAGLEAFPGSDFFNIPIQSINYANSVIPIILIVWAQSYIERFLKKISPEILAPVVNPLFTLILVSLLGLLVLGPIGNAFGEGIAAVLGALTTTVPWLVPTLMGLLSPFVIMAGVHYSLFPAATLSLTSLGYETILGPGMLAANMAHAGVALAVALKTKKTAYRSYSVSAAVTATMGVSQPALYGIELLLRKPLYAAILGGGIGGLYAGIFDVRAYAFANPSLPALPIYLDGGSNIIHAIIMMLIAFVAGFVLTWVLGFEEPSDEVVAQTTA